MQNIDQNKTANYGTVTGKTRANDASSDVAFAFSSGAGGSGAYSGTAVAIVPNMSTEKSYRVTVTVADVQGGKSISRTTTLTASFFTMDFAEGGRGVGILEAAPATGVTIGGNTMLHGDFNMEGNFMNFNTNNYDRDAAANESGQNGINVQFCDKDGERAGTIRVDRDTGGIMRMKIGAFTENASNQEVYNWLQFGINRDGTKYYSVSDVPKFRSDLGIVSKSGDTLTGTLSSQPGTGVSYIAGTAGTHAGLFVRKSALNQNVWIPAVTVQTNGGGGWAIGNYNDETLEFVYGSKANIDANKNQTEQLYFTSEGGVVTPYYLIATNSDYSASTTPDSTIWATIAAGRDSAGLDRAYIRQTAINDGYQGVQVETKRGSVYNGVRMEINSSGDRRVIVSDKTAWLSGIGAMGAVTKNGYGGLMHPGGSDTAYMRTTQNGLIPYQSGGASAVGTSTWPFNSGYFNTLYENGTALSTKYAAKSHGNHVPATQTASNKVFLRNDNTWHTITPADIGAAPSGHTHSAGRTTFSATSDATSINEALTTPVSITVNYTGKVPSGKVMTGLYGAQTNSGANF